MNRIIHATICARSDTDKSTRSNENEEEDMFIPKIFWEFHCRNSNGHMRCKNESIDLNIGNTFLLKQTTLPTFFCNQNPFAITLTHNHVGICRNEDYGFGGDGKSSSRAMILQEQSAFSNGANRNSFVRFYF